MKMIIAVPHAKALLLVIEPPSWLYPYCDPPPERMATSPALDAKKPSEQPISMTIVAKCQGVSIRRSVKNSTTMRMTR